MQYALLPPERVCGAPTHGGRDEVGPLVIFMVAKGLVWDETVLYAGIIAHLFRTCPITVVNYPHTSGGTFVRCSHDCPRRCINAPGLVRRQRY
jgi:hypothetical protein